MWLSLRCLHFWLSLAPAWTATGATVWLLHCSNCCVVSLTILISLENNIAAVGKRCQYYFIWGISEASLNAAGLGFSGFSDSENKQPRFDRYKNANPYQVCCHAPVPEVPPHGCMLQCSHFHRRRIFSISKCHTVDVYDLRSLVNCVSW